MAKIKIDNVKLVRADDRAMGEISFAVKPSIGVRFQFPDNHDLPSSSGDFILEAFHNGKKLELSDEQIEAILEALGGEFDDLSVRRLRDAARVIHKLAK